jgi:carbamoyl-phosphate synthase large subunit
VPFVAKVTGIPAAKIAARIMAGETLKSFKLPPQSFEFAAARHVGVKEAVFPFARFGPAVDTVLGPEMKSTGEVMGIDRDYNVAFVKSQLGGGTRLLAGLGFSVLATSGTQRYLAGEGLAAVRVNKVAEGRPHIVDAIKNDGVQLVFNTTEGATALADSRSLRRAALLHKVPYYTTLSGAVAAAQGIKAYLGGDLEVCALQNYFAAASDPTSDQPARRHV